MELSFWSHEKSFQCKQNLSEGRQQRIGCIHTVKKLRRGSLIRIIPEARWIQTWSVMNFGSDRDESVVRHWSFSEWTMQIPWYHRISSSWQYDLPMRISEVRMRRNWESLHLISLFKFSGFHQSVLWVHSTNQKTPYVNTRWWCTLEAGWRLASWIACAWRFIAGRARFDMTWKAEAGKNTSWSC